MEKTMKLGILSRNLTIKAEELPAQEDDSRTLELSFSSETPYERSWGVEILSHKADHVDMSFLGSGNAPLLAGHNHDDQIGVIEKAWLQDGVGRARVRFGKSNRADEVYQDVKDGIRKNVSVGYHIRQMEQLERSEKGVDSFLVTDWLPVETSIVSVPADSTIGFRAGSEDVETVVKTLEVKQEIEPKVNIMSEEKKEAPVKVDVSEDRAKERFRVREISAMGKQFEIDEKQIDNAIEKEMSVDDFRAMVMEKVIAEKSKPAVEMESFSDQDKKDMRQFSFLKALREAGENKLSGIEKEMHDEGVSELKKVGRAPEGQLTVPYQILAQRDINLQADDQGGYTVATNLLAGSFIELLQNKMKVKEMGATVLDNLVGDIAIPTQATGATAAWEGENDAGAESSPTFGQVALSPNRVGTYVDISNKLIVQSSLAVENLVRNLIADSIALAIDKAALHGTGSNDQPTGIAATSGIGSVAGGTNGLAPTYAHMIELETDVASSNADVGRMGYLTNAKVRGKLKQVFSNATYGEIPVWGADGTMNGYRAEVSNQVSSTLTKGSSTSVCSAIFFGNWADLILAFWGGMSFVVDPYTLSKTNITSIVANTYADVNVRHAASFSAMLDALTA